MTSRAGFGLVTAGLILASSAGIMPPPVHAAFVRARPASADDDEQPGALAKPGQAPDRANGNRNNRR